MNTEYEHRNFWDLPVPARVFGERVHVEKIINEADKLVKNPQIGFVYQIDVPIQDVGEYELILTLRLKE